MTRLMCVALVSMVLVGCMSTVNQTPYIAYQGPHNISNTAVFSADVSHGSASHIVSVDGVRTHTFSKGTPFWVRVTPGNHVFGITYRVYYYGLDYKIGETTIVIKDMKARHVYITEFIDHGKSFSVSYKDLGKNPKYGVHLGLSGYNEKYFPVKF